MNDSTFRKIELTLKSDDFISNYKFEGRLLGQAVNLDEEEKSLPQEVIQIYQNREGKFISYMEYSDRDNGIWESKIFVTDELDLAKIKKGLTRTGYDFGCLTVSNVPSKILGIAVYHAVEKLDYTEVNEEAKR